MLFLSFSLFLILTKLILASSDAKLLLLENQPNEIKNKVDSFNNALIESPSNIKGKYDLVTAHFISKVFRRRRLLPLVKSIDQELPSVEDIIKKISEDAIKEVPRNVIQNILDYTHPKRHEAMKPQDHRIMEFYDRIIYELEKSSQDETIPTPLPALDYTADFALKFSQKLSLHKRLYTPSGHDPFWHDLFRFLFKWVVEVRRRFSKNERVFNDIIEEINYSIQIAIGKLDFTIPSVLRKYDINNLKSLPQFSFSLFQRLLKYEAYDNPETLKTFITKLIPLLLDMNTEESTVTTANTPTTISVEQIRREFFGNCFNNDPLLKLMILYFTPYKIRTKLIKEKWFPAKDFYRFDDYKFTNAITNPMVEFYSESCKSKGDIIYYIDELDPRFLGISTIRFILDNPRLGFKIYSIKQLVDLLERIDHLGMLDEIRGKENSKFPLNRGIVMLKWNDEIFLQLLMEYQKDPSNEFSDNNRKKYFNSYLC